MLMRQLFQTYTIKNNKLTSTTVLGERPTEQLVTSSCSTWPYLIFWYQPRYPGLWWTGSTCPGACRTTSCCASLSRRSPAWPCSCPRWQWWPSLWTGTGSLSTPTSSRLDQDKPGHVYQQYFWSHVFYLLSSSTDLNFTRCHIFM